MNYVYILRCSDNTLYTGWTVNINNRLKVHNSGKGAKYTRGRLPVKLEYFEEHATKESATKREYNIKKLSKEKKEILIKKFKYQNEI